MESVLNVAKLLKGGQIRSELSYIAPALGCETANRARALVVFLPNKHRNSGQIQADFPTGDQGIWERNTRVMEYFTRKDDTDIWDALPSRGLGEPLIQANC